MTYTVWIRMNKYPEKTYSTEQVMCPVVKISDGHIYFDDRSTYYNGSYGRSLKTDAPPPLRFDSEEEAWNVAKQWVTLYKGPQWIGAFLEHGWVEVRK